MKLEVNCDWGENKPRQTIYKEVPHNPEISLQQRQFQVIERPTLRLYCSDCQLQLTRGILIITRADYYCVRCFSNLEEYPSEYLVRRALKDSFTGGSWDLMDEVVLTTAFKLWGFGNWGQIKEYLDYNCSPFPLKEVEQHFEKYYLHQPNYLPPFSQLAPATPKPTFAALNQDAYASTMKPLEGDLRRRDSKGEKRPLLPSQRSLSAIPSSRDIQVEPNPNPSKEDMVPEEPPMHPSGHALPTAPPEGQRRQKRNDCSVLGYNMKRKEFQLGQYDYTAENMLSQLQFYDNDSQQEFRLKLQIIAAYNQRLEERLRRRSFVIEYRLLDSQYHFHQQCKLDKQSLLFFQSLMRYTQSRQQYCTLVDAYSQERHYERFITNLTRIRRRAARKGTLEEAHQFMRNKRRKYIERWEKAYNKSYIDKQRAVLTRRKNAEGEEEKEIGKEWDDNLMVDETGKQVSVFSAPVDFKEILTSVLENPNDILRVGGLKVKTVYVPPNPIPFETPKIPSNNTTIDHNDGPNPNSNPNPNPNPNPNTDSNPNSDAS